MKLFRRGQGRVGFEVKFHRIAAEGNAVLTERTDALVFGPLRMQFWVCGVFEVHGGRITLWRDYFDIFDFLTRRPLRGLAGARGPLAAPDDVTLRAAQLTEFVERLRPPGQPIGGVDQLVAVALLRHRRAAAPARCWRPTPIALPR